LHYNVLVDDDNLQVTERGRELWKQGKKTFYCDNIRLEVSELIKINKL